MSSITEFIRRHRGKLIAGTVIAGGTYLAQKYLRQYYEERQQLDNDRNLAAAATAAFGMDPQRMMLQNRRFYIFDSNQRTCDNSILQIIPTIKTKLQKRFDVETLADNLKKQATGGSGTESSTTTNELENKLETWNQMKTEAFARLFSASISYAILVISLKTQISILAAQIYENSMKSVPNKYESWYSKIWYSMGGKMIDVKPRTGEAKRKLDVNVLKNSSSVQQLFLQALQFFVTKGVDSLTDFIQPIVAEQLSNVSLKEPLTFDQLKKLFQNLRTKIISGDSSGRHFSFYVVPLCHTGTLPDEPTLEELLILLKTVLESPDAQQLFDYSVSLFIDGSLNFIVDTVQEYQPPIDKGNQQKSRSTSSTNSTTLATSNIGVPMARLIPTLTDAFHDVSRVNFDSILSNLIISQEIHEYCVKVSKETKGCGCRIDFAADLKSCLVRKSISRGLGKCL